MKIFTFRSIRTQIITSTTLLILGLIGAVVAVWVKSENTLYRQEKLNNAKSISNVLSYTYANELSEENWSQIRLNIDLILRENKDFVYIFVVDNSQDNQIAAASPNEYQNQYIPNLVPLSVTNFALKSSAKTRVIETFALKDVYFGNELRTKRGESILEVASDIHTPAGKKKLGSLRIGLSLHTVDNAIANALNQALTVGSVGLAVGWVCAYILARQLSDPVQRLQSSVAQIAGGDLEHRADIDNRTDEIGALANSFNEMSATLQMSFNKLQNTLESFEKFVPNKFVSVISPAGIEDITVGMAATRKITILFCDIRGYTSMSEVMTPIEIFTFLNEYLACMGKAIDEYGGFIDKYIGDAIMALFDDDSTDCALKAAIAMITALDKFNHERLQKGLPNISVGIGIHRGTVIMGTIGFTSRIDSTVIGDAVNVASRIEGLTKQYNCNILITQSVVNSLYNSELFSLKLVDKSVKVKGKDQPISIYEVLI